MTYNVIAANLSVHAATCLKRKAKNQADFYQDDDAEGIVLVVVCTRHRVSHQVDYRVRCHQEHHFHEYGVERGILPDRLPSWKLDEPHCDQVHIFNNNPEAEVG